MSIALRHPPLITVEEYLAGEEVSPIKHEYLNGVVHAMAGSINRHSLISTNITSALGAHLKGNRCRPFNSDTKVRIEQGNDRRFYYPDAQIVCRQSPLDATFQEHPSVIFEVRSPSTARIDSGEKRDAYLRLPSLEAYVLVHDEQPAVTVWRRQGEQWESEYYTEPGDVIAFPGAECELPLAEIYEGAGV